MLHSKRWVITDNSLPYIYISQNDSGHSGKVFLVQVIWKFIHTTKQNLNPATKKQLRKKHSSMPIKKATHLETTHTNTLMSSTPGSKPSDRLRRPMSRPLCNFPIATWSWKSMRPTGVEPQQPSQCRKDKTSEIWKEKSFEIGVW